MKKITDFLRKYKHAWVFLYSFIYLPWYMYLERTVVSDYHIMHTWVDDLIPFNEYFIIPYFIWFIYVSSVLIFFFFKDVDEFYRFGTRHEHITVHLPDIPERNQFKTYES